MDYLKLLRSIISEKDVNLKNYKASTIRAVLFGQRQNEEILEECIKVALSKIEDNKKALNKYIKSIQKNTPEKNPKTYTSNKQKENENKLLAYINSEQNQEPIKEGEWLPLPPIDKENEPLVEFTNNWTNNVVTIKNYEEANRLYSELPVELKKNEQLIDYVIAHINRKDRYNIDVSKLEFD